MSNVVPFRMLRSPARQPGCDVVAVADDLIEMLDEAHSLVRRAAHTGRPARDVERTVQHLLDAVSALERALECLGEGSDSAPG